MIFPILSYNSEVWECMYTKILRNGIVSQKKKFTSNPACKRYLEVNNKLQKGL